MPATCEYCNLNKAKILRPKNRKKVCLPCFYEVFENEIHLTIIENKIFKKGEKIAMGASGGKDSTVLIHVMKTLNDKYDYGLNLFLLSIDEGITGNFFQFKKSSKKLKIEKNSDFNHFQVTEMILWKL